MKKLKELEIERINGTKELEKIDIELGKLKLKIIIKGKIRE